MSTTFTPSVNIAIAAAPVVLSGQSYNVIGGVGIASDGPANNPTLCTGSSASSIFGPVANRKYDLMTLIQESAVAGQNSVNFWAVRVTDGTDTPATAAIANSNCVVTSLYTGVNNNTATMNFGSGGISNSITVTVTKNGVATEVYPNLPSSNASVFGGALANAVNSGQGVSRGPSGVVKVSGTLSALPALPSALSLTGATDGANTINASVLVGSQSTPPKGMYGLHNLGALYLVLADADDSTQWTTIDSFAQAENMLAIQTCPAGSTPASAVALKQTSGLNSNRSVLLHGDWPSYTDATFGLRKISPQSFYAGLKASLDPSQSALNKPIEGIATTERISAGSPYSVAETELLFGAGLELITNPIPDGPSWGAAGGYNTSTTTLQNSDAWSSTINYIAQGLKSGCGGFVGQKNSTATQRAVKSTLGAFLGSMTPSWLPLNSDGSSPYQVVCDGTNNNALQQPYTLNATVNVTIAAVVRFFNITINGSAVVVTMSTTAPTGN